MTNPFSLLLAGLLPAAIALALGAGPISRKPDFRPAGHRGQGVPGK